MSESEAIALAKEVAAKRHWPWHGEGHAAKHGWLSRLISGKAIWRVQSHTGRGCRVVVEIDDATAEVLHQRFEAR